ncbi:hypothetical protein TNCV_1158891 [Trichonephila clavipes]|nr:hypothetical protein TNCV_1158891 [Trichonephila clavipes]
MYWITTSAGPSRRPGIFASDSLDQWPRVSRPMGKRAFIMLLELRHAGKKSNQRQERNSPHWSRCSSPIGRTNCLRKGGGVGREKKQILT